MSGLIPGCAENHPGRFEEITPLQEDLEDSRTLPDHLILQAGKFPARVHFLSTQAIYLAQVFYCIAYTYYQYLPYLLH